MCKVDMVFMYHTPFSYCGIGKTRSYRFRLVNLDFLFFAILKDDTCIADRKNSLAISSMVLSIICLKICLMSKYTSLNGLFVSC